MLAALRDYNRDDCVSTRQLADWLWALRCHARGLPAAHQLSGVTAIGVTTTGVTATGIGGAPQAAAREEGEPPPDKPPEEPPAATPAATPDLTVAQQGAQQRVDDEAELAKRLEGTDWPEGSALGGEAGAEVRETLSGLLQYHRRRDNS